MLLDRVRTLFGTRRLELYRALTLYDTRRTRTLGGRAFLDALVSAGLKLSTGQVLAITRTLCSAATQPGRGVPSPQDVSVDYTGFLDALFPDAV